MLFSVQRTTDKKKLFTWWLNAARKQVGITFRGSAGYTSLLYFSRVPFDATNWFRLTLNFRRFQKKKPIAELFLNDTKVEEKMLRRNFKDAILKSPQDNLLITLADMWGVTNPKSIPKVCYLIITPI